MSEILLSIESVDPVALLGEHNVKLNLFREAFSEINITARGGKIRFSGDKKIAQKAKSKFEMMLRLLKEHNELSTQTIEDLLNGENPFASKLSNGNATTIVSGRNGRQIKARTRNQKKLIEMSTDNDIVFAVGPAGTGKTYTAVALAVQALRNKLIKRIVITRPAVEAGENLGFLPGDLKDKIDPYLRPVYDALNDMIPYEKLDQLMESRIIEIAPLAFMRGRTLDNAFIILDEAQNCTAMQVKMFLTRLGPSAKCIITGDLSQVDLPHYQKSGLRSAINLLGDLKGIEVVYLTTEDVVRHRLVKEIIKAYDKDDAEKSEQREAEEKK